MKNNKHKDIDCLFCSGKLGLILEVETKFGKCFVCEDCAKKIYKDLGTKLIPKSVASLFQNRK